MVWTSYCCWNPELCVALKFHETYFSIIILLALQECWGIGHWLSWWQTPLSNCDNPSTRPLFQSIQSFNSRQPTARGRFLSEKQDSAPATSKPNQTLGIRGKEAESTSLEWHGQQIWPGLSLWLSQEQTTGTPGESKPRTLTCNKRVNMTLNQPQREGSLLVKP